MSTEGTENHGRELEYIALLSAFRSERTAAVEVIDKLEAALRSVFANMSAGELSDNDRELIRQALAAVVNLRKSPSAQTPLQLCVRNSRVWLDHTRAALIRAGWPDDALLNDLRDLQPRLAAIVQPNAEAKKETAA